MITDLIRLFILLILASIAIFEGWVILSAIIYIASLIFGGFIIYVWRKK